MLKALYETLADGCQKDIEEKYSKKHINKNIMSFVDTSDNDFLDLEARLHTYLNKSYTYRSKNLRVGLLIEHLELNYTEFLVKILIAVMPIQTINPIQTVCSKIANFLGYTSYIDGIKTAAELLAILEGPYFALYDNTYPNNLTGTMGIAYKYSLDPELEKYLEQVQYIPPMLTEPEPWIDNTSGGYLTFKDSIILGSANHHEEYQALDANNILQKNTYTLNKHILDYEEELSKELTTFDKQQQFMNQVRISNNIYKIYADTEFHFVWKNDKRGRLYSQGYHINIQSYEYKKAMIDSGQAILCD